MDAVGGELVGRDIVPEIAGLCAFGQQVSDHLAELPLPSSDLVVSV